jgi:hypothetical protein
VANIKINVYPRPRWKPNQRNTWEVWGATGMQGVIRADEAAMLVSLRTENPGASIIVHREPRKLKRPQSIWR